LRQLAKPIADLMRESRNCRTAAFTRPQAIWQTARGATNAGHWPADSTTTAADPQGGNQ